MLAPIIGGLLFDFVGYPFSALFIASWNLVSVVVEYMLLILIYRFGFTVSGTTRKISSLLIICTSGRDFPNLARKDHLDKLEEIKDSVGQKLKRSVNSWVMFYRHPAFFAVIALASTYMTVLSLDNGTIYATIFV